MQLGRNTLLGLMLVVLVGISGCALVVGNELGREGWDDDFGYHEYKEESSSDKALSRQVRKALYGDDETRRAGLKVRSRDGRVLVYGSSGDPEVVSHALRVVTAVEGVEEVTSRIELTR